MFVPPPTGGVEKVYLFPGKKQPTIGCTTEAYGSNRVVFFEKHGPQQTSSDFLQEETPAVQGEDFLTASA